MRSTLVIGLILGIAVIFPALLPRTLTVAQAPRPVAKKADVVGKRELLGAASCSASVCHGGSDLGQPFSEATTFFALDPHLRAYETLLSPTSQAIAKRLWAGTQQAHEAPLCLRCHVHPEYETARPNFRRADGVSCESCHGAAQDWLLLHYRTNRSLPELQSRGLKDTKSLPGRAEVCVACHVGTASANVDHDLIAAGHPALRFEFATYFANLPPHWNVDADRKRHANLDVRAWGVGQLVTAASAFKLLEQRANPATGKTWPEFAEFDCFACHHDLAHGRWRQSAQHLGPRTPGSLAPNAWHTAMSADLITAMVDPRLPRALVFDYRKRSPDRAALARHAKDAAGRLLATAAEPGDGAHEMAFLLATANRVTRDGIPGHWDVATQNYLALLAFREGLKHQNRELLGLESLLKSLRTELTFPAGLHSPPPRFMGPAPKVEGH